MGTTFINLQLKIQKEEIPQDEIPKGYVCKQTADEWTAIFEEENSFAIEKLIRLGKKFSKELGVPALAVSYFDDDEFTMTLLAEGKTRGSYRVGYEGNTCTGVTKWISDLALSKEEASAFRYLLKKELSANESIGLCSRLFGAMLYMDIRMYEESAPLFSKDASGIISEIREEKKRAQVKNQTTAKLLQEIPGYLHGDNKGSDKKDCLYMIYPAGDGSADYGHIHCLWITDGGMKEVHDYTYPAELFPEDAVFFNVDYEHDCIWIMDESNRGIDEISLKEWEKELNALMEIPTNTQMAHKEFKTVHFHIGYVISEGRYEYFSWQDGDCLKKADLALSGKKFREKKIVAVYKYEEADFEKEYWGCENRVPVLAGDTIVNLRIKYIRETESNQCDVRFFDKDLNLLRKEVLDIPDISGKARFSNDFAYCERNDSIYLAHMKIDLKTGEIIMGAPELEVVDRRFVHYNAKGEGFLYAIKGSSLYVFDLDLKLLGAHRLKGTIWYYYENDAKNICLITANNGKYKAGKIDEKSAVRLYEIDMD